MFLVVGCMGIWSVESQAFFGRGGGGGGVRRYFEISCIHVLGLCGFMGYRVVKT